MKICPRGPVVRVALALVLIVTMLGAAGPVAALARDPSDLCDLAADHASRTTGVPLDMLLAISRAETGRSRNGQLAPWPWAVNRAGEGFWFETASEAIRFANAELAANELNLDVGCFQINLRWHSTGFSSLNEMFDPEMNAAYAARFLSQLYQSEGGWPEAVAAYHSRNDKHAEVYLAKVERIYVNLAEQGAGASVEEGSGSESAAVVDQGENRFPLLQEGERGGLGSLVPFFAPVAPLFGAEP